MKKFLVAFMAVLMTLSVSAQGQKKEEKCCSADSKSVKKESVYSPETRAMMRVDRISNLAKTLTEAEKKELIKFFKVQNEKIDAQKAEGKEIDKEKIRLENNAELRKVLGDERYIKFLEDKVLKQHKAMRALKKKMRKQVAR